MISKTFKTQVVNVTPEVAARLLEMNISNRPEKKQKIQIYAAHMRRGLWKLNGEAIHISKTGRLLNGQNRLQAVIKSGCSIDFLIVSGLDDETFSTFDQCGTRSPADILAIKGIKNYQRVSSAIGGYFRLRQRMTPHKSILSRDCNLRTSKEDYISEYESSPELYDEVVNFCLKCHRRLNILSYGYLTSLVIYLIKNKLHTKQLVFHFINKLHFGENISNDTISALRDALIKDGLSQTKMTAVTKEAMIAKCWNAYFKNKSIKQIRPNEVDLENLDFL